MILEGRRTQSMRDGPIRFFHHLAQIKILHRKVIVVKAERTTHRGKVRLAQRCAYLVFVLQVASHGTHRAVNEQGRIITLGRKE